MSTLNNTRISLSLLNILLHTTCSFLLLHVYRYNRGSKTQKLYLLNLSVGELARNFEVFSYYVTILSITKNYELINCIAALLQLCVYLNYISAMFLITADRLTAGILNVRYSSVCTTFRTKIVISSSWFLSFVLIPSILVAVYGTTDYASMKEAFHHYFTCAGKVLHTSFFLFSVTTYITLFVIFLRSKRRTNFSHQSSFSILTHSNFHVAMLLVASFLVFQGIPGIMWVYVRLTQKDINALALIHLLLIFTSDTVDAVIYILMYAPVRRLLITRLTTLFRECTSERRQQAWTLQRYV